MESSRWQSEWSCHRQDEQCACTRSRCVSVYAPELVLIKAKQTPAALRKNPEMLIESSSSLSPSLLSFIKRRSGINPIPPTFKDRD